ncbi:hypothetical protein E5676_scaffold1323G00060 [Cucumis melo var. makuwa]|uniref:Uncharacterized protein n=1 Tax=Cucumis melo var. makuwa TaxID=1194695 RepID=A0A5A7T3U6_CUCMM|nr:hypothetical protein E6C27_scaffold69G00110 [Cucumis melo var. makuwa]TYK01763.1 hypothetical protein E5676_scaffold1323G00060 [Cucumis melo var. makuwa]
MAQTGVAWREAARLRRGRGSAWAQVLCACERGSLGSQGEGSTGSSLHVNGARGDPANTAASTAGFSGAWRRLADGFRLARRGDFRSAKAAACRRGSSACKTRRLPIRKGDGLLGCAASKLLTRRDGAGRTREFGSGVTAGLPYKLAGIRRWCDGARVGGG